MKGSTELLQIFIQSLVFKLQYFRLPSVSAHQDELLLAGTTRLPSLRPHAYLQRWIAVSTWGDSAWATTTPSSTRRNGSAWTAAPPTHCGRASSARTWRAAASWTSTRSNTLRSRATRWPWRCASWMSSASPAATTCSTTTPRATSSSCEGRCPQCAAPATAHCAPLPRDRRGRASHSQPCS